MSSSRIARAFDASPQPSKFIVIRRRSAVRDRAHRTRSANDRARARGKDRARAPSRSRSMSAATEGGETGAASEALDRVVLRYLHRRGYSSAAGVLRMEAKIAEKVQKGEAGVGGALASAMGADAAISDHLLFHTETEADPRALVDGYGALRDWAHNSLDLYKVRDARSARGGRARGDDGR